MLYAKYITIITIAYKYLIQRIIMIKKGLLLAFILIFTACAGTIRIAEESKNLATPVTTKGAVAKPKN